MANLKSVVAQMQNAVNWKDKYVPDFGELSRLVKQLKEASFRVVLTQGVYDMWHVGHGRYLAAAKQFGDVLIVGVDSDELTRKLKMANGGPPRPFDPFEERIETVGSQGTVDLTTKRDVDQHMYELIRVVRPDVLVLSKSTKTVKPKDIEALQKYCGRLEHLEPQASVSTTAKMRRLQGEAIEELVIDINKAVSTAISNYKERNGYVESDGVHTNGERPSSELVRAASGS